MSKGTERQESEATSRTRAPSDVLVEKSARDAAKFQQYEVDKLVVS